jgi:hypothetical protein
MTHRGFREKHWYSRLGSTRQVLTTSNSTKRHPAEGEITNQATPRRAQVLTFDPLAATMHSALRYLS